MKCAQVMTIFLDPEVQVRGDSIHDFLYVVIYYSR